jgi:hypothetical protein
VRVRGARGLAFGRRADDHRGGSDEDETPQHAFEDEDPAHHRLELLARERCGEALGFPRDQLEPLAQARPCRSVDVLLCGRVSGSHEPSIHPGVGPADLAMLHPTKIVARALCVLEVLRRFPASLGRVFPPFFERW